MSSRDGNEGDFERAPVGRLALRVSLLGGAVSWLLHLLLVYVVAEFGCLAGLGEVRFIGMTAVAWLLILVSVIALLMGAASTAVSHRAGGKLRAQSADPGRDFPAEAFAAQTGRMTNALFLFIILIESIPILYFLRHC